MNDLTEVIILIGGIYNLAFAIFHLFFGDSSSGRKTYPSLLSLTGQ